MVTPPKKNLKPIEKTNEKSWNSPVMKAKLTRLQSQAEQALILMGRELPKDKSA